MMFHAFFFCPQGRVYVENVTEEVCINPSQILSLMKKGDARRHWGRTNMNEHSSRSHTIFCIVSQPKNVAQSSVTTFISPSHMQGCDSSDFTLISDFFALHKTPFSCIEKHIFSGILDNFRLFLTDTLTPLHMH